MALYRILYWRDIPLQVRARDASNRASVPLSPRFQEAADRAAMLAGLTSSEDYSDQLRWGEPQEREGAARDVAEAIAAELEAGYASLGT